MTLTALELIRHYSEVTEIQGPTIILMIKVKKKLALFSMYFYGKI